MKSSNYNLVVRLQNWMDSIAGQTFLNYAYSWGASIVILGALFKLTHLPYANLMLYIGMGTEVFVFFISAFDRPFEAKEAEKAAKAEMGEELEPEGALEEGEEESATEPAQIVGGGTVIIGGGSFPAGSTATTTIIPEGPVAEGQTVVGGQPAVVGAPVGGGVVTGVAGVGGGIAIAGGAGMDATANAEMEEASQQYVEKLKLFTETLEKVEQQMQHMTTDSEEMTNLNRTLTGINTVYELQLKGVSQQIGSIEQINEQTRKMAAQIEELNGIYARMIKALTVNMKNASGQIDA